MMMRSPLRSLAFALLLASSPAAAQTVVQVPSLNAAAPLTGSELFPIYQGALPLVNTSPPAITTYAAAHWPSQSANQVFAAPNGSSGTPGFRALVGTDLPNPGASSLGGIESAACATHQWLNTVSTGGVPACAQPAFSDISGTAGIAQGGTGAGTAAAAISALMPTPTRAGDVAYWNGSNWVALAGNNSGTNCLSENGSGVPSFSSCGGGTGAMTLLNTVTAQGGTVTFTNGQAAIAFNNSFVAGQAVQFTTTGSLPTNFATATTYYVSATGLSSTGFEVAATVGGTPIVAGSAGSGTQTVSTFSLADLTSLTASYSSYVVKFINVVPATSAEPVELMLHSGGAFKNSGYITSTTTSTAGAVAAKSNITTYIPLSAATGTNSDPNNAAPGIGGHFNILNPSASAIALVEGQLVYESVAGNVSLSQIGGFWNTAAVIDGFEVEPASGGISSGVMKIYGVQ